MSTLVSNTVALGTLRFVLVCKSCQSKVPPTAWLQQRKLIVPQLQRLEIKESAELVPCEGCDREPVPCLSPASIGLLEILSSLGSWMQDLDLCLCLCFHMTFFLGGYECLYSIANRIHYEKDVIHTESGLQDDLILTNYIWKTVFQTRSHSKVLGVGTSTWNLRRHNWIKDSVNLFKVSSSSEVPWEITEVWVVWGDQMNPYKQGKEEYCFRSQEMCHSREVSWFFFNF